jgi:hypothetical protein
VFARDNATVFYLPGTTGWDPTFGGAPTALAGSLVGPFRCTTNNGTITITGYSGPGGAVSIPSIANGWPVTSIGDSAFASRSDVTSVTIPDSVTSIGDNAFSHCTSLTDVGIGSGVISIGYGAFTSCISLTNVTIGNSVSNIGRSAFWGCGKLRSVYFLGNAPSGDDWTVFAGDNTTVFYLPGTTGWGPTFGGAPTALVGSLVEPFRCTTNNGTITIIGYSGPGGAVIIPSIANGWPVTSIGDSAFESRSDVTSVTIPDSVTNIGETAFATCSSLSAITVGIDNPAYASVAGVLFDKGQATLIQYPAGKGGTSYTIPDGVTTIDDRAFMNCGLTRITIPDSVTSIGNYVFNACPNLTSITIPDSVTHLGDNGFCLCMNLTSVTIGNGVPSIEEGSFWGCTGLTNVTIGSSVTDIATWAFLGCSGLTSVTIPASVSSIGTVAFSGCMRLRAVCFLGNAPSGDSTVFSGDDNATVYYLPGTIGWGATFGGRPTALWVLPYPQILTSAPSFGIQSNRFGFIISWATDLSVVVEASTTLAQPVWLPLSTNALVNGWSYFSDPEWMNYPARFYRVRSP